MRRSSGLLCAFPIILLEHLQGRKSAKDLSPLLSPFDMEDMKRVGNRPLCVLSKLAHEYRTIPDANCDQGFLLFSSRERWVAWAGALPPH